MSNSSMANFLESSRLLIGNARGLDSAYMKTLKVARIAFAEVAFYDSPQELEKLGILARSAPRRKKAAAKSGAK